ALAIGQEKIAVGIDITEISRGRPSARIDMLACLFGLLVKAEAGAALEEDGADLADGQFCSAVVENMDRAKPRLAYGAGALAPFLRARTGEAAFARAVIFLDHRTPPVEHLFLYLGRTGCCGMERELHARQVIAKPNRFGQFEHTNEMGGHELCMSYPVTVDCGEHTLRIEVAHRDGCSAERLSAHGPGERGGMIEGGRREIDAIGIEAIFGSHQILDTGVLAEGGVGQRLQYALGRASGP